MEKVMYQFCEKKPGWATCWAIFDKLIWSPCFSWKVVAAFSSPPASHQLDLSEV
jgi:hypothetical protein